jgi:hypothetical protein
MVLDTADKYITGHPKDLESGKNRSCLPGFKLLQKKGGSTKTLLRKLQEMH